MNIRQSILIRTDLNLPVGLLAAQVAHLHMERFRNIIKGYRNLDHKGEISSFKMTPEESEWLDTPYLFVHAVPNKEVLEYFINEAKGKIFVSPWRDTVYVNISPTQRKAFPDVLVGAAFAPCDSDLIKSIIGDLPLL